MGKTWLVAKHEYLTLVRRRSFALATLGFPAIIVAIMAFSTLLAMRAGDNRPLGYVDQAGLLASASSLDTGSAQGLQAYEVESQARSALEQGSIQGYYLLPEDYLQTGRLQLIYLSQPPDEGRRRAFRDLLRSSLLADQPELVQQRLAQGANVVVRSADARRELSPSGIANVVLPFVMGFFFVYAVLSSAGYMLQAVTAEKENRTVELMATSLSPGQFIGGKAVGLLAVALTQLGVWVTALVGLWVVAALLVPELRSIQVSWSLILIVLLYFLPSFALICSIMIAIGSAVTAMQHGQQIASILNLLFIAPLFVLISLLANPDSPLAVAMTLFPTTSFLTVTFRWGLTDIPIWQLLVSWVLLMTSAALGVWAATRIYRVGMLRYGQQLSLASIMAAVRRSPAAPEIPS